MACATHGNSDAVCLVLHWRERMHLRLLSTGRLLPLIALAASVLITSICDERFSGHTEASIVSHLQLSQTAIPANSDITVEDGKSGPGMFAVQTLASRAISATPLSKSNEHWQALVNQPMQSLFQATHALLLL